ncbi:MAG: hypothetical protein JWM82_915 [Myxococcales bacterium]|nr:hypothetical protein [Myxococcales bacterium]
MGISEQRQFTAAVAARNTGLLTEDWKPAIYKLNGLAMFDMLPALATISPQLRKDVERVAPALVGMNATKRMMFANIVVGMREVADWSLSVPLDQINDGRAYLGCSRLNDIGVQQIISASLSKARAAVPNHPTYAKDPCAGVYQYAWLKVLVPQRQAPGGSLIANVAAAAHYMLSRYHVCAAKATIGQMKIVVDGYEMKKRAAISHGDPNLRSMAITANRPFPPDYAIRKWAYKGAADGDLDRRRCNPTKSLPLVAPQINQSEWGE